jgi:hypothetical protein
MTYYLAFLFTFIKYLINLTNFALYIKVLILKLIILFLLICCIIVVIYYPRTNYRFNKVSLLREFKKNFYNNIILSYKLETLMQFFFCFMAIIIYFIIFVCCLLFFKFSNIENKLNIASIYENISNIYIELSWFNRLYCICFSIFVFLLLILLLIKFKKLFIKPFNCIHFYLCQYKLYSRIYINFASKYAEQSFLYRIHKFIDKILSYILVGKIPVFAEDEPIYINLTSVEYSLRFENFFVSILERYIRNIIEILFTKLPHILIFVSIGYDLIFQNMILTKVYYIYPFAHIFQLYLGTSKFYQNRSFMLDDSFMQLLYKPETYSQSDIIQIPGYVLNNFVAPWLIEMENRQKIVKKIRKLKRIIKRRKIVKKLIKSFRFRRY